MKLGIPLISAAAQQFQGQVSLFRGQPCYRCFVGDAFDAEDCDTCAELGVLGALTGTIGNFAALLAIREIVGIAPGAAGTLHLFNGLTLDWRKIRIVADPACRVCGSYFFLAGAFRLAGALRLPFDGPLAAFSAINVTASSRVTALGSALFGSVAWVVPSLT